ncbi:hypothetical protein [Hydrocarboniphaga effusa]|uniref:hypothetical protein n=1 Tax=Hydrocarboniphaga effusa TaxID=243629 RepID=UPI00398BFF08
MSHRMGVLVLALALASGLGSAVQAAESQKARTQALPTVSADDIDLWAFSTVSASVSAKTVAEFRAIPNLASESKDDLRGLKEDNAEAQASYGPVGYRFTYSDGLDLRVLDYGESAFVTRMRLSGVDRVVKDEVKIGGPRSGIEAALGRPSRGGGSYAVYEGKNDVVRVFYTPAGLISAVEVDRGG